MTSDPDQELARRLRVFINNTTYTQASFAHAAGVSVKTIYNAMKAAVSPDIRNTINAALDELEETTPPSGYDTLQRLAKLEEQVDELTAQVTALADLLEPRG